MTILLYNQLGAMVPSCAIRVTISCGGFLFVAILKEESDLAEKSALNVFVHQLLPPTQTWSFSLLFCASIWGGHGGLFVANGRS